MSKHTQGEWQFKRAKDDGAILGFGVWANGNKILFLNADEYGYGNEAEAEANAKLIAAAPQMLEALTTIVSFLKANGFGAHRVYKDYIKDAQGAINKATI